MPSSNLSSNFISVQLPTIPNIKWLMVKAPFKKTLKHSPPVLPNNEIWVDEVKIDESKLALFHNVVAWQGEAAELHPCFIHTLAFPIHLKLLLEPTFPFPLLGLVHIENQIHQFRPVKRSETLKLVCRIGELEAHKKGWLFSVITECFSQEELVWKSASVNLFRTKHNAQVLVKSKNDCAFEQPISTLNWQLTSDLGRRYAKASGDFNPIHLRKWSAKLFGFKQHIAHGMWTKSRCLSELQILDAESFNQEFEVNCRFKQPLFLPAEVTMLTESATKELVDKGYQFKVETQFEQQDNIPHLAGDINYF